MKLNVLFLAMSAVVSIVFSTSVSALEITSAVYRSTGNGNGPYVTNQVKQQCKGATKSCEVICSNIMADQDPEHGVPKVCQVSYRCEDGNVRNVRGKEDQQFTLNCY